MTNDGTLFTLKAGKRYRLTAALRWNFNTSGSANATYAFVNTSNTVLGVPGVIYNQAGSATGDSEFPYAQYSVTPTVDTQVKLRVIGNSAAAGASFSTVGLDIQQLGTTAFSGSVVPMSRSSRPAERTLQALVSSMPSLNCKVVVGGAVMANHDKPTLSRWWWCIGWIPKDSLDAGSDRKLCRRDRGEWRAAATVGGATSFGALSTVNGGGNGGTGPSAVTNNVQFGMPGYPNGLGAHTTGTVLVDIVGAPGLPALFRKSSATTRLVALADRRLLVEVGTVRRVHRVPRTETQLRSH